MQTLYHDAMALAKTAKAKWKEQLDWESSDDDWLMAARNYAAANATINLLQPLVNRESFDNDKRKG